MPLSVQQAAHVKVCYYLFPFSTDLCFAVSSHPSHCKFCIAGTVVDCSDQRLTEIPTPLPTVTTDLILSNNAIKIIKSQSFANVPQLQKLDLSHNEISEVEAGAFLGCSNLLELQLTDNKLTKLKASMFTGIPGLRTL